MNSLMVAPTPGTVDLADLRDSQTAAYLVYYLGVRDLAVEGIPPRKVEIDSLTGEIVGGESDREYIMRIWPGLSREVKGLAARAGLQRAAMYREALADGIQLVVYRCRKHGWWITTDDNGGDDGAFRQWVRDAIVAEDGSPTEASQLATTIENLEFLQANGYKGLPCQWSCKKCGDSGVALQNGTDACPSCGKKKGLVWGAVDLEPIFADRSLYNRWRRVASGLRAKIEISKERPAVRTEIQEIINAVNDESKTTDELDEVGRKKAGVPLPPVMLIESSIRDDLGRRLFYGAATEAQWALLRSRLRDVVEFALPGQVYGISHVVLAEYRRNGDGKIARRVWDGQGWSGFQDVGQIPSGTLEGAPLHDPDLNLTYIRQWEVKDEWEEVDE